MYGCIPGHHSRDGQERLLRALADELGFTVRRKSKT